MNKIKVLLAFVLGAAFISYCVTWWKVFFIGSYYNHASFFATALYGASPLIIGYFLYELFKFLFKNN